MESSEVDLRSASDLLEAVTDGGPRRGGLGISLAEDAVRDPAPGLRSALRTGRGCCALVGEVCCGVVLLSFADELLVRKEGVDMFGRKLVGMLMEGKALESLLSALSPTE